MPELVLKKGGKTFTSDAESPCSCIAEMTTMVSIDIIIGAENGELWGQSELLVLSEFPG